MNPEEAVARLQKRYKWADSTQVWDRKDAGALRVILSALEAARAEAAAMREALVQACEAIPDAELGHPEYAGYKAHMKAGAALHSPGPGAALLERLRAAEAVCEAACELPLPPPDEPGKRPTPYADGVRCDELRALHAAREAWEKAKGGPGT